MRWLAGFGLAAMATAGTAQEAPGALTDDDLRAFLGSLALEARLDADFTGDGRRDVIYVAADRNERVLGLLDGNGYQPALGTRLLGEARLVPGPRSAVALGMQRGELVVDQVAGVDTVTTSTWRFRRGSARGARLVALASERYSESFQHPTVRLSWNLESGEWVVERGDAVTLDSGEQVYVYGPPTRSVRTSAPVPLAKSPDPVALLEGELRRGMVASQPRGSGSAAPRGR